MAPATTLATKLLLLSLVSSATNFYPVLADNTDGLAWENGSVCIPKKVTVTATVYPDGSWPATAEHVSGAEPSGWYQGPGGQGSGNGSQGGSHGGSGADSGYHDAADHGNVGQSNKDGSSSGTDRGQGAHNDGKGDSHGWHGQRPGPYGSAAAGNTVTSETITGKGHGAWPNGKPSGTPDRGQGGYGGGPWEEKQNEDGVLSQFPDS